MEGLVVFLILDLHIFLGLMAYKRRRAIGRWLEYPYYTEDDRETMIQRNIEDKKRSIEDKEKELVWLRSYNAKHQRGEERENE